MKTEYALSLGHSEGRNAEIEALRAIAVLFVVFHHFDSLCPWYSPTWMAIQSSMGFWSGVDLFFCISGFVIATSTARQFEAKRTHLDEFFRAVIAFWIRRVYRLIPSMWLWWLIVIVCSAIFNQSGAFGSVWKNIVDAMSAVFNIANWHWYQCISSGVNTCGNTGIHWTLSLEEQFYFVFPFLFLLSSKPRTFLIIFLILIQLPLERPHWSSSSLLAFIRTDSIFMGVLLAIAAKTPHFKLFEPIFLAKDYRRRLIIPLLILGIPLFATSQFVRQNGAVTFSTGLVALLSTALVFIASFNKGYLIQGGFLKNVLEYIGKRSYAMYLVHIPAFWLTREFWYRLMSPEAHFDGTFTLRFLLTSIPLIFILSELNYRLIEIPLRQRGREVAKRFQERTGHGVKPSSQTSAQASEGINLGLTMQEAN